MDFWNKARSFAEETAKRTQELTKEAARRSQDLSFGPSKLSDIIEETTKRSKEFAAQASKGADHIRIEAIKRADQIKHLADGISPPVGIAPTEPSAVIQDDELERFGITQELREFVREINMTTFRDFPLQDDTLLCDVPAVSNVRQDLTEWQARHANLVLSSVKEISNLRYELCPRVMKERKFWRIYFILVNSHIAPYEKRYMEDAKLISTEQENAKLNPTEQDKDNKAVESPKVELTSNQEEQEVKKENKTSTSSTEQDLDVFLLGDTGDSDDDPDDQNVGFDDDLDKLVDSSDEEKGKS
ncbi:hypothetical protein L6164_011283 [Bauhinia variegata]|uniref:Uncharacterized protein n=1 Tax=Bauhinia variegata TaxID=167791 RepID=A0ACB9P5F7_BAUVA|nr:hypothetical protein L6164_011283 [Bauhinia variegata]